MRFTCYTLGCKVNQYETQAMEQQLIRLGHTLSDEADSELFLINTCSVTAVADRKNRTLIRRLRREHPHAVIGICGCYAQVSPEEVRQLPVDVISGTAGREDFVRMVLEAAQRRDEAQQVALDEALRRRDFEILPPGGLATRTRAMLKVQDGCCNFCTYCIIPYARGPVRSLPLEKALEQARELAEAGYREIVLTGIEVASWGFEWKNGSKFADLVEAVCHAAPGVRIRLGSLEPRIVDEAFCQRLSACENLCPQFHLSLQSGSDTVLQRMHRKYSSARFLESVNLLKRFFPGCAVTTDVIVGFPGETEAEFQESLDFVRACGFAAMHVFPYSRRQGTPAANMPQQLPKAEKALRASKMGAAAKELRDIYDTAMIGSVQSVLFEQEEGEYFTGHAPNGVKVYARGEALHNQVLDVEICGRMPDGISGKICLRNNESSAILSKSEAAKK